MNQTKILTTIIPKEKVFILVQFIVLVGIVTAVPLLRQQAITGPIVNATLFISVALLGTQNAIFVGLIPGVIALSVGLLPVVLAPMLPFIMLGNTILIVVFGYFKEKNYWLGIILASALKFVFLFGASSMVMNLFLKKEIAQKAALMLGWPQLFTALIGGVIAYLILKKMRKI